MDGKQLKNSILQWAIQGKLVPQNPKDEPAQKLLERIAASRNGDVSPWSEAIGSSKNSKKSLSTSLRGPCKGTKQSKNPTSRIYRENGVWYEQVGSAAPKDISDEIPFEIPENWAWCRVSQVMDVKGGKRIPLGNSWMKTVTKHIYIRVTDMKNGTIIDRDLRYISDDVYEKIKNYTISKNDLYITVAGTIGAVGIVPEKFDNMNLTENADKITNICIDKDFIVKCFNSPFVQSQFKALTNQMAQPKLSIRNVLTTLFPLPPLAEQKRIVAKLEQVLPLAEEYGAAQEQLDKLNKELPEALKKSILQQAIQGKLVPQNPKDEPAQKILEKIALSRHSERSEESSKGSKKASLRGAKATKQSKNPPSRIYRENGVWYEQIGTATPKDISDEIPFEIPENWVWARWGELSDSIQYGYNAPALQSGRIKMVRISDIHDNKIEWSKVPYCQIKESEIPTYLLQKNDILFARTGGTVGKSYLVGDISTEAVYAGYLIRTRYNSELLSPQYLKFFMESSFYWEQLREGTIATAQPNCNGKTLGKMLLPLPPLAEQKRIVAKLEQLFKVL
ncbi:hypothetical protein B7990_01150 [Fibrobacter sp. UWB4]|uniref:restriction endonuclease subunit S n=1 Tax=Fibrobacter sp. UWB4 TaxID=1964356 RepID=UPI000B5246E8|nr:restriction endonuclease subunit S [Fibrobacter sp. UWB4]OWV19810.1 hypothetical protein B7990_01150 [Fibrobacter sp. UWB4]